MRVLFILNAFGPISGAEHVLLDFLKTAPEIEPLLLQIGPKRNDLGEYSSIISNKNCFYVFADAPLMSALSRQWFMGILRNILNKRIEKNETIVRLLNDASIELIYFNNSFEAAVFYPLFKGKKNLVHIHDMVDMFRPAHKKCVLKACEKAGYVLTASESCRTMLVQNGINERKILTAYNGIDLPEIQYEVKNSEEFVVGFVGSAIKRKGLDIYVSILNGLKKTDVFRKRKLTSVVITNSKSSNPFLKDCLSKLDADIKSRVFCGIPREQVFDQYKEMSLLLVPSRYDPLPTVVLEASMQGVPVMGSKKDGIPEMQPDCDMLFEVDDVREAISKIEKWVMLPYETQRQKMGEVQKYIKSTFTMENKKKIVLKGITEAIK